MKIKFNYILIGLIVVLVILSGYLLVDKFVLSKSKTIICKFNKEEESLNYVVKKTIKVNAVGMITTEKTEVITTYNKESDYEHIKEYYATQDAKVKFNDKKLMVNDIQFEGKMKDAEGNELELWYYSYINGLKDSGYKCK